MYKKELFKVFLAAIILGCTSCSDILDKGPLDSFTEDDVWENSELAQAFLYPSLNYSISTLICDDRWSDNDVIYNDGNISNINKEQIDHYYDAGWNVFSYIRKCNLAIEKISNNNIFSEDEKKYLIAQAKMQRAMIYFSRARLFGKFIKVEKVLNANDNLELPRTKTIKETYDFILKDLQEASKDLPSSVNNSEKGMLTKGAAYALLAEVALHGAAYIESGQDEYYLIAKNASEELFKLGYELDTNYGKMFNEFDYSLNSKEIILGLWKHENNTTFQDTWMQSMVPCIDNNILKPEAKPKLNDLFSGWIGIYPSVDLVNSYEVVDIDGVAKEWDATSYYLNYKNNGGYVSEAIYSNRDKRFYETIVSDSTKFFNSLITTRENGNLHWNSRVGTDWGTALTGYVYRKGIYLDKAVIPTTPTYYHYVVLRLGRSYLNYAEVMLRMNDVSTAVKYINKTRSVHGGLPELPDNMSLEEAWNAYKSERRVELVHEGDRYWSLLRWGKADGKETIEELNKVHQSINISEDGKFFEFIDLPYQRDFNYRIFTKKRYLFPVPEGERVQNSSLDQNEGW